MSVVIIAPDSDGDGITIRIPHASMTEFAEAFKLAERIGRRIFLKNDNDLFLVADFEEIKPTACENDLTIQLVDRLDQMICKVDREDVYSTEFEDMASRSGWVHVLTLKADTQTHVGNNPVNPQSNGREYRSKSSDYY